MQKSNYSSLTDNELVRKVAQEQCSESITELMARHQPLVTSVAKKYSSVVRASGTCLKDMIDNTPFVVYEAAKSFDESHKVKFTTWLHTQARFSCLKALRANQNHYNGQFVYDETYVNSIPDTFDPTDVDEERLNYIKGILSEVKDQRIRTIIQMRYFNAGNEIVSYKLIAKRLGMSIEGVRLLHNSFIRFVSEKMKEQREFA